MHLTCCRKKPGETPAPVSRACEVCPPVAGAAYEEQVSCMQEVEDLLHGKGQDEAAEPASIRCQARRADAPGSVSVFLIWKWQAKIQKLSLTLNT